VDGGARIIQALPCRILAMGNLAAAFYRAAARAPKSLRNPAVTDGDRELLAAFPRGGGRCGICGRLVSPKWSWPHRLSPTLDHIQPTSRGGGDERRNLQLAHWGCNRRKGARWLAR